MADPRRIVIVGGGIAGLSAAYAAVKRGRETGQAVEITVVDRATRLGGNVVTETVDGFVLDGGPDSWVVTKPQATALAKELGLGGDLLSTNPDNRRYFVAWGDRLHPVPEGLVLGVPTRIGPLARSNLFSWGGKLRMAWERFVPPRRFEGDDDEAIGDFATRRLGREAADRLVAPLLGGISGGDASDISVRASFPMLVDMESKYGSLMKGMLEQRKARAKAASAHGEKANGAGAKKAEPSAFVSLRHGVGALTTALLERLAADGVTLRAGSGAVAIEREGGAWAVRTEDGARLPADGVVLGVPGKTSARLLGDVDRALTEDLSTIAYGTTATVFLGYRRADVSHPLDGVGFVVPRSAGRPILAGTWVSSKWDHRAPEGHVLLRAFFGGPAGTGVLAKSDDELVALARGEHKVLMGFDAEPVLAKVFRFPEASAQMHVGHIAKMRRIRETLARVAPGVLVAGGGYDGVGIPDCVRQGSEAGAALV